MFKFSLVSLMSLIMSLVIFSSCGEKTKCNKFNPTESCYEKPSLPRLAGPQDNSVITTDTVTFSWGGNSSFSEYRYQIDTLPFSSWSTSVTTVTKLLDDGLHTITVDTRYVDGLTTDNLVTKRSFVVNALDTPSVFLYPRVAVANNNKVMLNLQSKGIDLCNQIHVTLRGATIDSVVTAIADTISVMSSVAGGSVVGDSVIDLFTDPSKAFSGSRTLAFLYLTLNPLAFSSKDTSEVVISTCKAFRPSASLDTMNIKEIRGAVIVK